MIWRDAVRLALENIGGLGTLGQIYKSVDLLRSANNEPLPASWQAIVRRELEYNSSDSQSFQHQHDIFYSVKGIGGGVWGLRSMEVITPVAIDAADPNKPLIRLETYRILRDTEMARRVKKLHGNTCQVCGVKLQLLGGETYAEAHHIKPLGMPHNGPDIPTNILVLCPTDHVLCDYGAIELDPKRLRIINGHSINPEYIEYHNRQIFGGR